MFALEITASAESDLDQITDYLSRSLSNPQAALALLDDIERISEILEATPELFPLCSDSRLARLGYRKAVVRTYVLVYEIDRDGHIVRVLRFFHSLENYADKL